MTKEQAITCPPGTVLHYTGIMPCTRTFGPRGATYEHVVRVRVSGRCLTWVTHPEAFRLPVKHGLYEHYEVNEQNCADFHLEAECPLTQSVSRVDPTAIIPTPQAS